MGDLILIKSTGIGKLPTYHNKDNNVTFIECLAFARFPVLTH